MTTDTDRPRTARASDSEQGDPLTAFVPRLAVELGREPVPSWTSVEGSMLSADISGFTALSEKLAGKGKAGAEEITSLINTCFTALIESAYEYGGEVIKFGGDALLILFRGDNHERRAADAGLLMQRALHSSPAAKRANLTMTVGAAAGPFDVFLVGSGYRELLITGPRATEVIRLEGEAAKGDTLVDALIADRLPADMKLREEHGGWVITGSTGDEPSGPGERNLSGSNLTPYVPATVVDQLAAFAEMGGEHRLVTVGFAMVVGVHDQLERLGPVGVAEALSDLVDTVVEACDAFGVTVLHTDIAPDGIKFVLCAGAPVSPGDTTDALLQAALQVAASDSPFVIRQGVQAGRVFAGFLGSPHRRTYTLMGDPVNTAARMLGKAADRDIVAVASAVDDTRAVFETEVLEPFLVKGKTEPITAAKVRGLTGNVRRDVAGTRLVGRQRELEILTHAIGELDGVIELVGTAGVGKSRLLDAAWGAAEGLRIYQGACTPYGAASPYSVFRPLLRSGSGIPVDASAELTGNRLTDIVAEYSPELAPMLPLLALPFGAAVAGTPEADAIDSEFRRIRIHDVVVQFLDATLTGPILLVVEDAHWIDDASGELLNHLVVASRSRPWAGIVTRRPEGEWTAPIDDHVERIELEPLDDDAVRRLAVDVSTRALSDRDLDVVAERSQGNPLFAVELARALSDASDNTELPDTIEQIIASRFDLLDPAARRLIRTASVLGNVFHEAILGEMLSATDATTDVDAAFTAAAGVGAITRRPGSRWAFNHALYRDTAYQGLPFNRRRQLHRLAAEVIEVRAPDTTAVAPVLSLHYSEARVHDLAWEYSLRAADAAEAQNATAEAATALERALASGRHCRRVPRSRRAEVAERLGDLAFALGRFTAAEQAFSTARRLTADRTQRVRLMRKIGAIRERQGQPARAWSWYRRAATQISPGERQSELLVEGALIDLAQAGLCHREGDNERCAQLARQALGAAQQAGDAEAEALALERLHLAAVYLRQVDEDRAGPRALEAHQRQDDRNGMVRTLINLGIEAYFAGDWTAASQSYLDAVEVGQQAGNVILTATAAMNSAEILTDQGHWDRAIELLDNAVRNFDAVGYPVGVAAARLFAGVAEMRRGRHAEAGASLAEARQRLDRLGVAELLEEVSVRDLELELLQGGCSVERCDDVLRQFEPDHPFRSRVLRVRGLVRNAAGDHDALDDVQKALDLEPTGLELALTLATYRLAADRDAPGTEGSIEQICAELGIVRLPPLVGSRVTVGT